MVIDTKDFKEVLDDLVLETLKELDSSMVETNNKQPENERMSSMGLLVYSMQNMLVAQTFKEKLLKKFHIEE